MLPASRVYTDARKLVSLNFSKVVPTECLPLFGYWIVGLSPLSFCAAYGGYTTIRLPLLTAIETHRGFSLQWPRKMAQADIRPAHHFAVLDLAVQLAHPMYSDFNRVSE